MSHDARCENASNYACVCPCGGARHGAILIRGISSTDPASQEKAANWVRSQQWSQLSSAAKQSGAGASSAVRRPLLTGVLTELVATLIAQVQESGQADAVEVLANEISHEIGKELEMHLTSGGPHHRSNRHLWCVALTTICRVYDEIGGLTQQSIQDFTDRVMQKIRDEISLERGEKISVRDIYWRSSGIRSAFETDQYDWLGMLIKKALRSIEAYAKLVFC